ncbi:MaoC family dehydratase [Methylocystis heyeri]|uniref:Dehydratase n=1 Tax=Methylocystis heyeri TaxID=391905 RepID=A0A6B8KEV1_9HYPH|nr:MaoC family dehydratase [Methylocystis heyeri]QGM46207.1 dehydratase [Methylocystis heyeri]
MTEELFLEDLEAGQRFQAGEIRLAAEDIIRFARDNDPQFFHLDPEAAKSSMFGGLVASGWQTAALSMRLLIERGAPFAGGVIGAGCEIAWPRPVRPGDTLRIECEILKTTPSRSRPERGIALIKLVTYNQKDEPVLAMTANVVVPTRSGLQSGPAV